LRDFSWVAELRCAIQAVLASDFVNKCGTNEMDFSDYIIYV